MLKDQSVVGRRRSLCLALLKSHLAEWIDSTDGIEFGTSYLLLQFGIFLCYHAVALCQIYLYYAIVGMS